MKSAFFTPRWIITTLLVLLAVGVMVRLGFWQLDRLAQRRAFNARVEAQINASPLDLNKNNSVDQLSTMEYRSVVVRGTYDPQNEVVLRNQVNNNQPGYHLLTPLRIAGSQAAVLVDRGFIPMVENGSGSLASYAQPGEVTVHGIIRLPYVPRYFGVPDPTLDPGKNRLAAWNSVNLPRIQSQTPYALLPVYVEVSPENTAANTGSQSDVLAAPGLAVTGDGKPPVYPIPSADQPDLTEGPHMGYAFQWFSFAATLALGYPYFVKKQLSPARKTGGTKSPGSTFKAEQK
jgi:surfeit locus 1 family protein